MYGHWRTVTMNALSAEKAAQAKGESTMQATGSATAVAPASHKKFYHHLYFQVLCAIVLGVLVGYFYPQFGASLKWLGDLFVKLIKMLIAPIIFCTVVHGIASMEDMKKVGRAGVKALVYPQSRNTIGTDGVVR